jgi:hypothetical protein
MEKDKKQSRTHLCFAGFSAVGKKKIKRRERKLNIKQIRTCVANLQSWLPLAITTPNK